VAFDSLADKLSAAFKKLRSKGKLTEQDVKTSMREVRLALLEADVNYKVAKEFTANVTERAVGTEVLESLTPAQQVIKIVDEEMTALMGGEQSKINMASKPPTVILLCGLQGSGKTTHAAKLAAMFKKNGHRPLLVACDVYRPAAIKQLQVVGERAGVPVFEKGTGDAVKIAKEAVSNAKDHGNDVVIIDTAGRLQVDVKLMDELKRMKQQVEPNEILLVVDAMTGQDAVNVASAFNEQLGIDGIILTKLDGDTRGGAALSVRAVTGRPIKFVGVGEKLDDLEPFYPDRMASRILGMGDVLTLIDKAKEQVDEKKAMELAKKLKSNEFNFNDLLDQVRQIRKMGSVRSMLEMVPGVSDKIKNVDIDENKFFRIEAIITSMTPKEREKPDIINPSRKRRIAAGSGTKVEDVNRLLKQLAQMRKMMKQLGGKKGKMKRRPFMPF
jgi:signal recognition particle subunit SRP54